MLAKDLRERRFAEEIFGAQLVGRHEPDRITDDGVLVIQAGGRGRVAGIRTSDVRIRRAISIRDVDVDVDLVILATHPVQGAARIVLMVEGQLEREAIIEEALFKGGVDRIPLLPFILVGTIEEVPVEVEYAGILQNRVGIINATGDQGLAPWYTAQVVGADALHVSLGRRQGTRQEGREDASKGIAARVLDALGDLGLGRDRHDRGTRHHFGSTHGRKSIGIRYVIQVRRGILVVVDDVRPVRPGLIPNGEGVPQIATLAARHRG